MLGCNLANVVIGEEWQYESECRMFFMAKTNGHIAESSWTFCACGAHHKSVCFGDKKMIMSGMHLMAMYVMCTQEPMYCDFALACFIVPVAAPTI